MDIILDEVTNRVMAELEKTQKDFWKNRCSFKYVHKNDERTKCS